MNKSTNCLSFSNKAFKFFFLNYSMLAISDGVEFGGPCPLTAAFLLSNGVLTNFKSISNTFVIFGIKATMKTYYSYSSLNTTLNTRVFISELFLIFRAYPNTKLHIT